MSGGDATQRHLIKIELLNEETIVPFGEIISGRRGTRPPDFEGVETEAWYIDYRTRGTPMVVSIHTRYGPLVFNRLERHMNVTQTFIPTGGAVSVVALAAAPDDPDDWTKMPRPEDVQGFLINGTSYMLKRGTWHSLDRFPLHPPGADFVVVTDWETQNELKNKPMSEWRLTQDINYDEQCGVTFELVL